VTLTREDLTAAILANIERGLELDGRMAAAVACAAWPDVRPTAAGEKLRRMRRGEGLTPANLSALALALGLECDALTSTRTPAAVAAREEQDR
jgi:hypothetical protein